MRRAAQGDQLGGRAVGETGAPEGAWLVSHGLDTPRSGYSTSSGGSTGIPFRADLRRERPDLDEALGVRLVEGVSGVVGREIEVVQALRAGAAGDGRPSTLQRHPDLAADHLLRVIDEDVEAALEAGIPEPVVDQAGPLRLDAALEPVHVAFEREVLEFLVGGDEGDGRGGLVDLAAIDADQAILDDVDASDAVLAREHVELLDGLQ